VQSAGRSAHRPNAGPPVARIAPVNALDLIAAIACVRCTERLAIEPTDLCDGNVDVALQAVLGLCALGPISKPEIATVLRRAAPFAMIDDSTIDEMLDYLATGSEPFASYDDARRLAADSSGRFEHASARSRRAYVCAIGTITDAPAVPVREVSAARIVGRLDGRWAVVLEVGDRFALGGSLWRVVSRTPVEIGVARDRSQAGPSARWLGARLAWSDEITAECERFFGALDRIVHDDHEGDAAEVSELLGVCDGNARAVVGLVRAQRAVSAMPTPARFVVELLRDGTRLHVVAHTFAGANANEVIGRIAGVRLRRADGRGAEIVASDTAVAITIALEGLRVPLDEVALREVFDPNSLERDLSVALDGGTIARAHFRGVARVAQLAVPTDRPGAASPELLYEVLRKNTPGHLLLRALDHTVYQSLDGARAARVLADAQRKRWHITHLRSAPSALSVPLFAYGSRDRVAPDDLGGALVAAAHALYLRCGATDLP
jgi:ATP-dependent Lhr-like helicase